MKAECESPGLQGGAFVGDGVGLLGIGPAIIVNELILVIVVVKISILGGAESRLAHEGTTGFALLRVLIAVELELLSAQCRSLFFLQTEYTLMI
jgi:hypothetical protein